MKNSRDYLGLNLPPSIPIPGFIPFLDNLNNFNNSNIRCTILRENYKKLLIESGYKTTALNLAFKNFPIAISQNADLLGQLISQLPYTSYLEKTCDKNKLLIKNTSVIGFSAGGLNVQKAYNKNFKFIGLIDPSTRAENVKKDYGNNVKMFYNDANWGGYPQIKSVLPNLADAINKLGGDAEKVNLQHSKIPSYFFNKYKDDIA